MATITFSGLASGIDGDSVIKALAESRRLATVPLQNKIDHNEKENSALEEFNTKLLALRDALEEFASYNGGGITKSASVSNDDALNVSVGSGAAPVATTVEIKNLARTASFSFSDTFSKTDAPLMPGLEGTAEISLTVGSGKSAETFTVTVDNTTTLSELATAINGSCEEKVQASIINRGSPEKPEYVLLLQTLQTGTEKGNLVVDVPAIVTEQGVFQTLSGQQAEDAVLWISGIGELNRGSNHITDLIPGITLDLVQENTGPIQISVGSDADKTADKFSKVIAAVNDLITYAKTNNTIERIEDEDSVDNVYGSLAKTRVDDRAIDSIRRAISDADSGLESASVRILADLGLTTERDGTFKFDAAVFSDAVNKDPAAAGRLLNNLADKLAKTDGLIAQYTRFGGMIDSALDANENETSSLNERISRTESYIEKQSEQMRLLFARLESTISELNSQGDSLLSILARMNN